MERYEDDLEAAQKRLEQLEAAFATVPPKGPEEPTEAPVEKPVDTGTRSTSNATSAVPEGFDGVTTSKDHDAQDSGCPAFVRWASHET